MQNRSSRINKAVRPDNRAFIKKLTRISVSYSFIVPPSSSADRCHHKYGSQAPEKLVKFDQNVLAVLWHLAAPQNESDIGLRLEPGKVNG
jgi:hypothetical protein